MTTIILKTVDLILETFASSWKLLEERGMRRISKRHSPFIPVFWWSKNAKNPFYLHLTDTDFLHFLTMQWLSEYLKSTENLKLTFLSLTSGMLEKSKIEKKIGLQRDENWWSGVFVDGDSWDKIQWGIGRFEYMP